MRDYYKILEVSRDATSEQINASYRRLAKKYHPDVNSGEDASTKFKEVAEAYDILGNPAKRSNYDRQALRPFRFRNRPDFVDDVFNQFFGEQTAIHGTRVRMDVSLEDVFFGTTHKIDVPGSNRCDSCDGTGVNEWDGCKVCGGAGMVSATQANFVLRTTCQNCGGRGKVPQSRCEKCSGKGILPNSGRQVEFSVPLGAEDGTQIRISGESADGTDLYVLINVKKHNLYERQGRNLFRKYYVTYTQLVLGDEIEVDTLGGKVTAKIRPRTQNGTKLRLKEQGLPMMQNPTIKGDLYLILEVIIPKTIDKKENELLKRLAVLEKKREKIDG
jgi:molecular chaperone DnaJ